LQILFQAEPERRAPAKYSEVRSGQAFSIPKGRYRPIYSELSIFDVHGTVDHARSTQIEVASVNELEIDPRGLMRLVDEILTRHP
jgi:hypothetical protein